jgi:hypothetical protein
MDLEPFRLARIAGTGIVIAAFPAFAREADKGWDYYADAFEVLAPDGRARAAQAQRVRRYLEKSGAALLASKEAT